MKLTPVIVVVLIGVVTVAMPGTVMPQSQKKQTIVLGEEFAKARAAEERRKKRAGLGKSPIPATTYDFWRGEESLINPTKNSLDAELIGLCERFAKSNARARAGLRNSISLDEFYTLLTFSRRSAVFAIRERNVNMVRNGLTAVAMIEAERTDFRDIISVLALLYHSAKRVGGDADQLFRETAKLSEPQLSTFLTQFIRRPSEDKDIRSAWLVDEVETKDGVGFIGYGTETYQPTYDLKSIAIDIADLIAKDKYQPDSVEVATELPAVWLKSAENRSLEAVLTKVRAGASIFAKLRPNEHPTHESHILMIFLVEVEDERAAQELLDMSKKKRPTDYALIGVSEQRLFCLIIARSWQGVPTFETAETLQRLTPGIAAILKTYAK